MARSAKKIGDDMTRTFRRVLSCERDLRRAHAEGDWDGAWKKAVELNAAIDRSARQVRDFLKAVRLPGIDDDGD